GLPTGGRVRAATTDHLLAEWFCLSAIPLENLMFKVASLTALVVLISLIAVPSARANNVHFVDPLTVSVDVAGLTASVSGKIAGVGNKDVVVTVEVFATAEIWAYNPASTPPPGKKKVPFYSGEQQLFHPDDKNGNVPFSLTADFSPPLDSALANTILPNDNWVAEPKKVGGKKVRITVQQGGKTVLSQTINNP